MGDVFAYGIDPDDRSYYSDMIRREKSLTQGDQENYQLAPQMAAVMVLVAPAGFVDGHCSILRRDPLYPYCYEVSVNGYPGFGVLDSFRGRLGTGDDAELFEFSRTADAETIIRAFPASVRNRMIVTGGQVLVNNSTYENPDWSESSAADVPRYLVGEFTVSTGRLFIGFEEPVDLFFAETDHPTEAQIAALGFDQDGNPREPETDDSGFTTNGDSRVTVRFRQVNFLCSPLTVTCQTLVDTSQPSPIAAGALAYAAQIPGIGFSLTSVEPRVYQELSGVFDRFFYDDSDTEEVEPEPESESE